MEEGNRQVVQLRISYWEPWSWDLAREEGQWIQPQLLIDPHQKRKSFVNFTTKARFSRRGKRRKPSVVSRWSL